MTTPVSTTDAPRDPKEIIEAPWNTNVMDPEMYKQLLQDMKQVGPDGTDPIHIAEVVVNGIPSTLTTDGAHRLRAAKQLGWNLIRTTYHHEITTEEEARIFNYRRDAERGEVDQFKLAETFKWFSDQGFNHNVIAERFGVDRSTVTKRVGLLTLDEKVKTHMMKEEGATISHLEPLATLTPELQREAAGHLHDYDQLHRQQLTVKSVQNIVDGLKRREALKEQWLDRVAKSKFAKCPRCKQDPVLPHSYYGPDEYLHCGNRHEWSMKTGKTANENALDQITHVGGQKVTHAGGQRISKEPKRPKVWAQQIRSQHETREYDQAYWAFFRELWPKLAAVEKVSLIGTLKNGDKVDLDYHWLEGYAGTKSSSFGYRSGKIGYGYKEGDIFLKVEEMTAPTLKKKGYKSRVFGWRPITGQGQLDKLTETSEKFLSDYGKVPRGTKEAKK